MLLILGPDINFAECKAPWWLHDIVFSILFDRDN
jgi:hypothetical protein